MQMSLEKLYSQLLFNIFICVRPAKLKGALEIEYNPSLFYDIFDPIMDAASFRSS